jgi:hypothetical protein
LLLTFAVAAFHVSRMLCLVEAKNLHV